MTSRRSDRGGFPPEETLRGWIDDLASTDEERARAAFTELDRACRPLLLAAARPLVADMMEVEDALQDLLTWLWMSRRRIRIRGRVGRYLLVSIRNRGFKASRWHDRVHQLPEEPTEGRTLLEWTRPSSLFGPEKELYALELNERLEQAFASLSDRRRQVLHLFGRGLTYGEIGEFVGMTTGAVGKLILRARRDLDAFMGWLHEEADEV